MGEGLQRARAAVVGVKVGQVWKDNDPRMTHRPEMTVLRIEGDYVFLGKQNGKTIRVKLARMKPINTGYRLVRDV